MNYRISTILLAVALLLVLGVSTIQAAPLDQPAASANPAVGYAATAGNYDYTAHGTAWVAERRWKLNTFRPNAWGMITSIKAAGSEWVHISVPFPSRIADSPMKIKYVEFCAQSTNGASTKPVRMDLWDYYSRFLSVNITWPANNDKNCFGYTFTTPIWKQDLGVSVLLSFANTTDKITLYKAWTRVAP